MRIILVSLLVFLTVSQEFVYADSSPLTIVCTKSVVHQFLEFGQVPRISLRHVPPGGMQFLSLSVVLKGVTDKKESIKLDEKILRVIADGNPAKYYGYRTATRGIVYDGFPTLWLSGKPAAATDELIFLVPTDAKHLTLEIGGQTTRLLPRKAFGKECAPAIQVLDHSFVPLPSRRLVDRSGWRDRNKSLCEVNAQHGRLLFMHLRITPTSPAEEGAKFTFYHKLLWITDNGVAIYPCIAAEDSDGYFMPNIIATRTSARGRRWESINIKVYFLIPDKGTDFKLHYSQGPGVEINLE